MTVVGTIGQLTRYPVKSMQGEDVEYAPIGAGGIEADRGLAVKDVETGKVASAKRPRLWRGLLGCHAAADGGGTVVALPDGRRYPASSTALDAALGQFVARPVRVVRASDTRDELYESDWPRIEGLTLAGSHDFPVSLGSEGTTFVDIAALHLVTTTTLYHLRRLAAGSNLDVRRFRPNIVIDSPALPPGFVEDGWVGRRLRLGATVEITVSMPTPRCVMTTVEQPGLARDPAVLRTTAQHNRHSFDGFGVFACAGVYAEVTVPGTVAVGDEVTVS